METKNNTTLIIDGNWLLMSRLGMIMDQFKKDQSQEDLTRARNNMVDFVAQSINKAINFWGNNIDNFIMVQDGGSWRKTLERPKLYTTTYKGNRVTADDIAWDYIWGALHDICNAFKENNILCVTEKLVEGDDWCWYWSRYLNHEGINAIIWTSDADLKQLVQKDSSTGAWTAWYNDSKGLVLNQDLDRDSMDILLNFEAQDPFLESICSQTQSVTYINPDDVVMEKVICGDSGDNIKSILRMETVNSKGDPRTIQVSKKEWGKVKEELGITSFGGFVEKKMDIIKHLLNSKRFSKYDGDINDVVDMFDFNIILVRLHKDQIPHNIAMAMNKHKDEYIITDMDYLRNNYKVLAPQNEVVEDLFKDIPF